MKTTNSNKLADLITIREPLTKYEEEMLLDALVAELPFGYVRDILSTERLAILDAIKSDLGFIDFNRTVQAVLAERAELEVLTKKAQELRNAISESERKLQRAKSDLADIKRAAATLASL